MLRIGSIAAAVAFAVACCRGTTAAGQPADDGHDLAHVLFFSGGDLWRQGAFLYGGAMWMPDGLAADGFVLKLLAAHGFYRYRSGALGGVQVKGFLTGASVMPGYRFTRSGLTVTAFAGPDWQNHFLVPDDPDNPARGRHIGLRGAIDVWAEPTTTSMVSANATFSTIASSYAARLATGWRVFDWFYLGPEGRIYGAGSYRQMRLGVQVTAVKFGSWEWEGSIGYAFDSDDQRGAYAQIGLNVRD